MKERQAIVDIVNILGAPRACSCNSCEGCKYEMEEAVITGLEALGYLTITHTKTGESRNVMGRAVEEFDTKIEPEPMAAWVEFMRVEFGRDVSDFASRNASAE